MVRRAQSSCAPNSIQMKNKQVLQEYKLDFFLLSCSKKCSLHIFIIAEQFGMLFT
jgi:hypothetical protein